MSSVIVLAGGTSDERAVSLRSGAAVSAALQAASHDVTVLDPADGLTKELLVGHDVVFPVLHGAGGEDGSLQTQLDIFRLPYVGTGAAASALCFDKWQYKQLLAEHDLPHPAGELVDETKFRQSPLITRPFVLKPFDGGSSIDTLLVRSLVEPLDKNAVSALFAKHPRMLLEELIVGTEITVAVLGDQCLPVIEIIPPSGGEFDYENKYNGQSQELCPPEHVSDAVQHKAQELALRVHQLAGCRDFSRTDFMIDAGGNLYILETNTIPGMTDQSLLPKAAAVSGLTMPQLMDRLVRLALAHH